jgi:hypothetical protein
MKLKQSLIFVGACLTLACNEDVDSEDIRTHGMYAIYEAVADGSGETEIVTQLRVGGDNGTFVELSGEDELTAMTEDEDVVLRHKNSGNKHYYEGSLDGDYEGLEIQIALTRGGNDDDAVDSFAELPAPFDAALEDEKAEYVLRESDVSIIWDNEASGKMEWSLEGDCIKSASGSTNDDGSLTLKAEDIEVWESDKGEACDVTVTLDRVSDGETDSAFGDGGEFKAIQRRTVTFNSMPAEGEVDD